MLLKLDQSSPPSPLAPPNDLAISHFVPKDSHSPISFSSSVYSRISFYDGFPYVRLVLLLRTMLVTVSFRMDEDSARGRMACFNVLKALLSCRR